jgi:hypothetical protein
MAGECDLCLIVVESRIPPPIVEKLQEMVIGNAAILGGELRFFLGEKSVWRDMAPPHMYWGQTDELVEYGASKYSLDKWRQEVDKRLRKLMEVEKDHIDRRSLEFLGESLWSGLLPDDLKDRLRKAAEAAGPDKAPVLRIHTHMDWIPWEIMRMDTDYLGLRFQIARLPLLPVAHMAESEVRQVASIYNLLGKGLLSEALQTDWKTTFSFPVLDPISAAIHSFPSAEEPEGYPFLRTLETALKEGADIIHITCTGKIREKGDGEFEPYWTLDEDNREVYRYEIDKANISLAQTRKSIGQHRPLVFANACGSAEAGRHLEDFGPTFMRHGSLAFVGAFAAINKDVAVRFAGEFYRRLLEPQKTEENAKEKQLSIGEALWATKRHFLKEEEADPSFLFYRLYGLPETRFELNAGP